MQSKAPISRHDQRALDNWLFRDREAVERRFDMQLEKVLELYNSDEGRKDLLERMQQADPSLNGNVEGALEQVNLNMEQLKKKESFLMKILKLPVRAVQAVGRTMKKHPILTTLAGIAALIALLYFTPVLAPTAGEYGRKLIQAFKKVIAKVGIATPEAATDVIADLPVTGGDVPMEVIERAGEAFRSPGQVDELQRVLQELTK